MPPSIRLASGDQNSDPTNAKKKRWLPEEGVVKWATNKGADVWAGFGKEKSGWKVCSVYWLKRDDGWVLAESISRWRADGGPYGL